MIMKNALAVFAILFPIAGAVFAQNDPITGISESTDPAKVAEVERRAQEIMARQESATSGASGTSGSSATSESGQKKAHKGGKAKKHKGGKGATSTDSGNSGSTGQK
jgi:hypothetical protein